MRLKFQNSRQHKNATSKNSNSIFKGVEHYGTASRSGVFVGQKRQEFNKYFCPKCKILLLTSNGVKAIVI